MMTRRAFLRTFAPLVLSPAAVAFGQAAQTRIHRVGFLEAGAASVNRHYLDAFIRGLRESGYVEGRNLIIEVRWAEGRAERFAELLRELVDVKPDVIVVASTQGAVEARKIVKSIPVVFVGASDPQDMGLVKSLARPGGNMT